MGEACWPGRRVMWMRACAARAAIGVRAGGGVKGVKEHRRRVWRLRAGGDQTTARQAWREGRHASRLPPARANRRLGAFFFPTSSLTPSAAALSCMKHGDTQLHTYGTCARPTCASLGCKANNHNFRNCVTRPVIPSPPSHRLPSCVPLDSLRASHYLCQHVFSLEPR